MIESSIEGTYSGFRHSERSEESSFYMLSGFFASLRMTNSYLNYVVHYSARSAICSIHRLSGLFASLRMTNFHFIREHL
jgi:hypothetical protein